jgi:hypothetical protein
MRMGGFWGIHRVVGVGVCIFFQKVFWVFWVGRVLICNFFGRFGGDLGV